MATMTFLWWSCIFILLVSLVHNNFVHKKTDKRPCGRLYRGQYPHLIGQHLFMILDRDNSCVCLMFNYTRTKIWAFLVLRIIISHFFSHMVATVLLYRDHNFITLHYKIVQLTDLDFLFQDMFTRLLA